MSPRAAIAKVKIAAKELGLDDDTYRAMLARITGQSSAAHCSEAQLARVLDEMKAKGWKPRIVQGGRKGPRSKVQPAQSRMAKKARAMWISLHQLGAVRDPRESALEAFGRRQLGVDKLVWADEGQAYRLIEALKAMAERAGWGQDLYLVPRDQHVAVLKARLEAALAARRAE
ncbi:MAG: regulatory protein GemA [Candidatus Brevundimonas colombiensis]|uniref:Regulatory protein GemA n=1 Tax=Candidatus Brevundimonas colombiensis TaxID=3121376 RepID=A0AAJ6BKN4_9CAUL|nr:regulatory protein GemA [Brevundimonas sp.]WEK38661.1 MAG: regulatory protein GemA [Brevundimonas sp.]